MDVKESSEGPGDKAPSRPSETRPGRGLRERLSSLDPAVLRIVIGAVSGLIVGLMIGGLLLGRDEESSPDLTRAADTTGSTLALSPPELAREARALGRPVYWAGPQDGATIEFKRSPEGNVSVRYIPEGEDLDGPAADYLTIVTYPYPDARAALEEQAAGGGVISRELPQGGFVISQPDSPTNAYLAYAGEDYQVEVYDPRPGRALKLILEGAVLATG